MSLKPLLALLIPSFVLFASFANAQLLNLLNLTNQSQNNTEIIGLSLSANPSPAPSGSTVIVSAKIDNGSPASLDFSWFLDDNYAPEQSGINRPSFDFIASQAGQKHKVALRLKTNDGKIFEDIIIIPVNELTLLWESDTFTPHNYFGRRLASPGSQVTVAAITDIGPAASTNFTWIIDDKTQLDQSGFGKNSLTFTTSNGSQKRHQVVLTASINNSQISELIEIPIVKPIANISFKKTEASKEKSGLNEITLDPGEESILEAKTFYFTKKPKDLSFEWFFNDRMINPLAKTGDNVLQLKIPKELTQDKAQIKTRVTNNQIAAQNAIAQFSVNISP